MKEKIKVKGLDYLLTLEQAEAMAQFALKYPAHKLLVRELRNKKNDRIPLRSLSLWDFCEINRIKFSEEIFPAPVAYRTSVQKKALQRGCNMEILSDLTGVSSRALSKFFDGEALIIPRLNVPDLIGTLKLSSDELSQIECPVIYRHKVRFSRFYLEEVGLDSPVLQDLVVVRPTIQYLVDSEVKYKQDTLLFSYSTKLRKVLFARGKSLYWLSRILGEPLSTLKEIEGGFAPCPDELARRIAWALRCSLSDVTDFKGEE